MSIEKLTELSQSANIANMLDEDKLSEIAHEVLEGYEQDLSTMQDWLDESNDIMKLIHLKGEKKMFPFENAANIKYPLITLSIIQFASRTLPEVIKSSKAVHYKIVGRPDEQGLKARKGRRVADFLNYKLLEESATWIEERDRLFHVVAALGQAFTKSYYNPLKNKIESKLVPYNKLIVNNNITSLEDAPRISHIIEMSENDILVGQRLGYFSKIDIETLEDGEAEPGWHEMPEFIEQHCLLDLDEDGFAEPYMVIVHPKTAQILRIRANYLPNQIEVNDDQEVIRIRPMEFFTDYQFMPNPDGSFFGIGFGSLLRTTNETVNTLFNQLVDAGTLANLQGGFIGSGVKIDKRHYKQQPGEWISVGGALGQKLRDQMVELNYKEPSVVLFQLMQFLINASKELTSTTEALTGNAETQNTSPSTLMALIQQGLTVFTMIQKRMYRGMQKEFKKVYALTAQYTTEEEYLNILDLNEQELQEVVNQNGQISDFDLASIDITPVSDFNSASETELAIQSKGLDELVALYGPRINLEKVIIKKLEALKIQDPESYLAPAPQGPTPDQIQAQLDAIDLQIKQQKNEIEASRVQAQIEKDRSQAIKNLAEAEAAEAGQQFQMYNAQLKAMTDLHKVQAQREMNTNGETSPGTTE